MFRPGADASWHRGRLPPAAVGRGWPVGGTTTQQIRRSTPLRSRPAPARGWRWPVPPVAGALGVVAGILPAGWPVGLVLAATAMVLGARGMRRGPAWPGFGPSRTGLVLGLIAMLLGVLGAALWLLA